MDILNITAQQYDKMILKEGRDVVVDGQRFRFLVRSLSSKTAQESITVYYSQRYNIGKGTIFELEGEHFLIINRRSWDSDVFYTSTAIRTNVEWTIEGKKYYLVCGDLGSSNPKHGSVASVVNGSISLYTGKSYMLYINESVYDFGGTYKCVNKYDIDGLTYYYFQRDLNHFYQYNMADINGVSTVQLTSVGEKVTVHPETVYTDTNGELNRHYMLENDIIFSSSDQSVATVNSDGIITAIGQGNCTITATRTIIKYSPTAESRWTEQTYTCNYTVTVGGSAPESSSDYYATITYSGTNDAIKIGGSAKTMTSHVFATADDTEQEAEAGTWWLTWDLTEAGANAGYVIEDLITENGSAINKWKVRIPSNGNSNGLNMQMLTNYCTTITAHWMSNDGYVTTQDLTVSYM